MIFRNAALQRLASPDQLDEAVEITAPTGWLALAAAGAVLAVAVSWSVFGSIPEKGAGEGILLGAGGTATVVTTGRGRVSVMWVEIGDEVERGQLLARLSQPVLERQIRDDERSLEQLFGRHAHLVEFAARERALRAEGLAAKRRGLTQTIAGVAEGVAVHDERMRAKQELLTAGLLPRETVLYARQEGNRARDELTRLRLELDGLELTDLEAERGLAQRLAESERAVRQAEAELSGLRADQRRHAEVRSPYRGRVVELLGKQGELVEHGAPLLTLELESDEVVAVVYVPALQAKLIEAGMVAEVTPATVKREEFGSIRGVVSSVGEFPATSVAARRLLSNDDLVRRLMAQASPHEVRIALERDADTPSGYAWSSGRGPALAVTSGTQLYASVIVREQAPIQLLIPRLEKALLGSEGLAEPVGRP